MYEKRWYKANCECCGDFRTIIHVGLGFCWKCYEGWRIDNDPNYDKHKRSSAYRKHKLTKDAYNALLKGQGNVCAICHQHSYQFVVDHCHTTGSIRGILCRNCNSALGLFKESIASLSNAVKYLYRTAFKDNEMSNETITDLT